VDAGVTGAELQFREFFAAEYGRLRGLGYLLTSDWGEEAVQPDLGLEGLVLWAAVRRLPARQRAVLVLGYHEDLPEAEVARLLRLPLGTVKSLAHRGLARLRAELGSPTMEQTRGSRP
jgi:hypothetical protein